MRLLDEIILDLNHTDVGADKLLAVIPGDYPNGSATDVFIGGVSTFDGAQTMRMRGQGGPDGSIPGTQYFRVDKSHLAAGSATCAFTSGDPFIMQAIAIDYRTGIPVLFGQMEISIAANPTSGTFKGTILVFDRFAETSIKGNA